jgi:hypothetical protein
MVMGVFCFFLFVFFGFFSVNMAVGHSQNSSPESREIRTEYCLTEALVRYKGYLECSGDEKLKWWGDLRSLKAFVFALFGQDCK